MYLPLEQILLIVAVLLVVSIIASKLAARVGFPALVAFLALGMLLGSDGPGHIHFDNAQAVQSVGVIALVFILFSGGLDTAWNATRKVLWKGLSLSTVGVVVSSFVIAWFAMLALPLSPLEALLLGGILSCTDAPAVFAIFKASKGGLKEPVRTIVEFESSSNDPMSVFLTVALIGLITNPESNWLALAPSFVWQMSAGGVMGVVLGWATCKALNRSRLEFDGLYPVMTFAVALLIYGAATVVKANGFLAVYAAGIVIGNSPIVHRRSLMLFHDGLAWLMQITMFLILGLQVFPSQLPPLAFSGSVVALGAMFVARPVSVLASLCFSRMGLRPLAMISWTGLRGAVPIVLATFPMLEQLENAQLIFDVVFFAVFFSVLVQGSSIPLVGKWLGMLRPEKESVRGEFFSPKTSDTRQMTFSVDSASFACNRQVVDLALPRGVVLLLVERDDQNIIPAGGTVLLTGDKVQAVGTPQQLLDLRRLFSSSP